MVRKKLVHPDHALAPMPHGDLPQDCNIDYLEARSIISRSPRGAAALLRLIIQKLIAYAAPLKQEALFLVLLEVQLHYYDSLSKSL